MDTDDSIPLATDPATKVKDTAIRALETTRDKAVEALNSAEDYVSENPATAALAILGIGFLIGLVVGRNMHEGA